ncbi:MAG: hypothetical protein R2724_32225 [Bryobacterales bacterium]
MAKFTTTKLVEAVLLNKNTGMPTSKRIDLPFGAIIQDPEEDRDLLKFTYLGERYGTNLANIRGHYEPIGKQPTTAKKTESAPAAAPEKSLEFRPVKSNLAIKRAKVPGGWLIALGDSVTFLPDAGHKWDGSSL